MKPGHVPDPTCSTFSEHKTSRAECIVLELSMEKGSDRRRHVAPRLAAKGLLISTSYMTEESILEEAITRYIRRSSRFVVWCMLRAQETGICASSTALNAARVRRTECLWCLAAKEPLPLTL